MRAIQVCITILVALRACAVTQAERVAIVGGGLGGTSTAYFLRQLQPQMHLELFERDRIGGRTDELHYAGRVFELGASIIHAHNQHVLSLAKAMNLTAVDADNDNQHVGQDDGAFSIFDGKTFVFKQTGSQLSDIVAVLRRYGISPLRYKWFSKKMSAKFSGIYELQQQGQAFATPKALLRALGLFDLTQVDAQTYMQDVLNHGVLRFGSERFITELAAAVNRVNYNQRNEVLNALAGLVSYLPAAQPDVFRIKEGNALLPQRLAAAAAPQAVHLGTAVQAVQMQADGRYKILAAAAAAAAHGQSQQQQQQQEFGPFDAVAIAAPLEGSGMVLDGLPNPQPQVANRTYQTTVTTLVAGAAMNPAYFNVSRLPAGDIPVTNSADTPFTVISSKGVVSDNPCNSSVTDCQDTSTVHQPSNACASDHQAVETGTEIDHNADSQQNVPQQQQQQQQQRWQQQQQRVWKIFSESPLSDDLINQLFINGSVIISKSWKAYPRFHPPEGFAPFLLHPGLCYVNALENAASALEIAAVAGKNCALLLHQQFIAAAAAAVGRGTDGIDDSGDSSIGFDESSGVFIGNIVTPAATCFKLAEPQLAETYEESSFPKLTLPAARLACKQPRVMACRKVRCKLVFAAKTW